MSIRHRLLLIAGIPLIVMLVFVGLDLQKAWSERRHALESSAAIRKVVKFADLIASLQRERGTSAGFTSSRGRQFRQELETYRQATNDASSAFYDIRERLREIDPELETRVERQLDQLSVTRRAVSDLGLTVPEIARFYTAVINDLHDFIDRTFDKYGAYDMLGARAHLTYLYAIEEAGLERAMGASGFGSGRFEEATFERFIGHGAAQSTLVQTAIRLAPREQSRRLTELENGSLSDAVRNFRERAHDLVFEEGAASVSAADWWDAATARIDAMIEVDHQFAEVVANAAATEASRANRVLLLGGGFALIVIVGTIAFAFYSGLGMIRPLNAFNEAMSRIARKDYSAEIDGTERRDEIGVMAKTLIQFRDDLVRGAAADRERQAMEAERAQVVDALKLGLTKVSQGDLTARLDPKISVQYEQLLTDFNSAVAKLREALNAVVINADGIRTGALEISQAADDLSRRTENQAATLEETAASLEEITASVKSAMAGAEEANQIVVDARRDAEASGDVVRDAVDAMSAIENSAEQISQIISVIDDIAFQTNLLALNAGVEAARAGDAGRGFAVVASEVRALAQRSSDAAKEIKGLISTSSGHVERGVDLVGRTGKALEDIVASVANITSRVSEIASSSKEQATGIAEINAAVSQLDQVTQQNAAMVEQSTAASHSLNQEAEELSQLVRRFKTGAEGVSPSRTAKTARPAARAGERNRHDKAASAMATRAEVRSPGHGLNGSAHDAAYRDGGNGVAEDAGSWQDF